MNKFKKGDFFKTFKFIYLITDVRRDENKCDILYYDGRQVSGLNLQSMEEIYSLVTDREKAVQTMLNYLKANNGMDMIAKYRRFLSWANYND